MTKRRLGVNIDHIATLREARKVSYPDPFDSLKILKKCHVDQVTVHLREDRRHIQDYDVKRIVEAGGLPVNLELVVTQDMIKIASRLKVQTCTFVPEKRHEITTEGGLNVTRAQRKIARAIEALKKQKKHVSLFLDPDCKQICEGHKLGMEAVELHTGSYCHELEKYFAKNGTYKWDAKTRLGQRVEKEYQKLFDATTYTKSLGLKVYAGHGLHLKNLRPLKKIKDIEEYNIGHALIGDAVFTGLENAIKAYQKILK